MQGAEAATRCFPLYMRLACLRCNGGKRIPGMPPGVNTKTTSIIHRGGRSFVSPTIFDSLLKTSFPKFRYRARPKTESVIYNNNPEGSVHVDRPQSQLRPHLPYP